MRIQVLSNIQVFEWIMHYAEYQHCKAMGVDKPKPVMQLGKLSSILNSAEYLGMTKLVLQCIKFAKDNLRELSQMPKTQ